MTNNISSSEHAKKHLCKGIRKPRFREGQMQYPVFYALCFARDIKLSVLAKEIEVNRSMPTRWINGEYMPSENNIEKIESFFQISRYKLFSEPKNPLITYATEEERKGYSFKQYKTIKYTILYGLIYTYGYSVHSLSDKFNLDYRKLSEFIRLGIYKTSSDFIEQLNMLEKIFGLDLNILLHEES